MTHASSTGRPSMVFPRYRFCAAALALLPWVALARPARADDKQYTVIEGSGEALQKIAIPPVLGGGGAAAAARTVGEVLARDLTLIGTFKVLPSQGFLANLSREGTSIAPKDWLNIGAQGVIKARATVDSGKLSVDFFLYDPAKGTAPVLQKTYADSLRSTRRVAHRFANDVVKFYTGENGPFLSRIAFASGDRRAGSAQIYVIDFDGYGAYRVSNTGKLNVLPSWSPDGSKLLYTSFLWRNPDLFMVPSGGGRAMRISKHSGLNTGGVYSPRGNVIALTLTKDGNPEIYVINPSGGIVRRLTQDPAIDTSPSFSPDGGQIAFVSNRAGSPQIYVMSANGGGARRLTFQGSYNQEPDWCPDPSTPLIAFTGRDERGSFDIFTVNVRSGEVKRLTQGQGSNTSPSWAPGGQLLVYASSRGGLWVMTPEGLNQTRIYAGSAMTPRWSN